MIEDLNSYDQSRSEVLLLDILKELNSKYPARGNGRRNLKNEEFHSHKDYHNTVNNYIFGNLLFYTVLLKEFIVTFCEINTLNAKDIYFFDETLRKQRNMGDLTN